MIYEKYLNSMVKTIPLSGIRLVNSWPSQVPESDWIRLNIGQPDLLTPEYIKKATIEAINKNLTRYTDIMGDLSLRNEICSYFKRNQGLKYEPNQILVTAGGQSAIFATLKAILSPNDNVVVPFPSYPPYINVIKYNRANIIPLVTKVENNFDLPINELKAVLKKTPIKALLLISPGNPTGAIIPSQTLKVIVKLAIEYDFLLISDEIYNQIIFSDSKYDSIASFPHAQERTLIIQSFSKMLSMCGYRIGFIAAPSSLIEKIKVIHHTMNICVNSIAQYAACKALSKPEEMKREIKNLVKIFKRRRDLCIEYLHNCELLEFSKPEGTFYVFPRVPNQDMTEFAKWLKLKYGVLTVPGSYFSISNVSEHNQYLRICYTTDLNTLEIGLQKFCDALNLYTSKNQ